MKSLRPFLQRLRQDEDFRLNVTYAIVMPLYVAGILGMFWWGMTFGRSPTL